MLDFRDSFFNMEYNKGCRNKAHSKYDTDSMKQTKYIVKINTVRWCFMSYEFISRFTEFVIKLKAIMKQI